MTNFTLTWIEGSTYAADVLSQNACIVFNSGEKNTKE